MAHRGSKRGNVRDGKTAAMPEQIRIVSARHPIYFEGALIPVTDNPALAMATRDVIHRDAATKLVELGAARWADDAEIAEQDAKRKEAVREQMEMAERGAEAAGTRPAIEIAAERQAQQNEYEALAAWAAPRRSLAVQLAGEILGPSLCLSWRNGIPRTVSWYERSGVAEQLLQSLLDFRDGRRRAFHNDGRSVPAADFDGAVGAGKVNRRGLNELFVRADIYCADRAAEPAIIPTGAPGRPTAMDFIKREHKRRIDAGRSLKGTGKEAEALRDWLVNTHTDAAPPTVKTIRNAIGKDHRAAGWANDRGPARN